MSTSRPSYRAVLGTPHLVRSFVPSILGRLSLATSTLALVLLLQRTTGSFAVAGGVTAAFGVGNVLATPLRAGLIDRRGQALVMAVLGTAHTGLLVALGFVAAAPLPALLVLAVLAGATCPPFGPPMRVVMASALAEGPARTRGFGLDAVTGELIYAVGPLVTALLAVVAGPLAALLVSAGCVATGSALFVSSPLSRRQRGVPRDRAAPVRSPLRKRGFPPVAIVMLAPGIVLGGVDIAAPAVGAASGSTLLSGVLLALFAGASAASGLLFGLLRIRAPLERQLLVLALILVVVGVGAGLIAQTPAAPAGFLASGVSLAPVLIVGYLAGNARADAAVRTEANSWLDTAVLSGSAAGAAAVGQLTDRVGSGPSLALVVAAAGVIVLACAPFLARGVRASKDAVE